MRQGKAKYLFPGNNTPKGFISRYRDGLKGCSQVYILKGGPGTGKSTLMRKIGAAMLERGYDVEFWQCSSDNDSIDGVMIPRLSVAVIDGTPPHSMDPRYPGVIEEIVDLGQHWDKNMLKKKKQEIIALTDEISSHFNKGYEELAEINGMLEKQKAALHPNEDMLAELNQRMVRDIFRKADCSRHLFASAVTPRGLISFADSLSRCASRRWLVYGAIGCGKEKLLQMLADEAEAKGHYIEIYHHALRPDDIQLLLIPGLDVSVTDWGEEAPDDTEGYEKVIDCNKLCGENISCCGKELDEAVEAAATHLAAAKDAHDKLEKHYQKAMDFDGVDETASALFNRILALATGNQ